jgi:hypothetical protein
MSLGMPALLLVETVTCVADAAIVFSACPASAHVIQSADGKCS